MHLKLSRKAQADLDDLRDYSVERFGAARAIRYLDVIDQAFRRLLTYPVIGSARDNARPGLRIFTCERHPIFYEMQGEAILIVRILHEAMDSARHL